MTVEHPFREGHAARTMYGYRTEGHPTLDRIQNGISAVSGWIAAVCVLGIVVLTLLEVALRTFFGHPLGWTVSFIQQHLLTGAAFFGIVLAYRSGAHVAVVSIFNRLAQPMRKVLLIIAYALVAVGLIALGTSGWTSMTFSIVMSEGPIPGSSQLPLPTWTWKAMIPVASILGLIIVLIDLLRECTAPFRVVATDYDPGQDTDEATALAPTDTEGALS